VASPLVQDETMETTPVWIKFLGLLMEFLTPLACRPYVIRLVKPFWLMIVSCMRVINTLLTFWWIWMLDLGYMSL
jgi:hypothetical protein